MSTSFLLVYLVILILSGCTTIEKPIDNSLINREEESVKAIAEEWRKSRCDYLDRSLEVAGQVGLLGRHPGWSDMVDIMRANQGITFVEGEEVAKVKTRLAFDEWSKKWQTSWVEMLTIYVDLREKSMALNDEREELARQRHQLYTRQVGVHRMKFDSGLEPLVMRKLAFDEVGRTLDHDLELLNFYRLNSLRLYELVAR